MKSVSVYQSSLADVLASGLCQMLFSRHLFLFKSASIFPRQSSHQCLYFVKRSALELWHLRASLQGQFFPIVIVRCVLSPPCAVYTSESTGPLNTGLSKITLSSVPNSSKTYRKVVATDLLRRSTLWTIIPFSRLLGPEDAW